MFTIIYISGDLSLISIYIIRHRQEVVEHNRRLDELRKYYLKERQELSTMLVSAIQRQEVRSDTISSSDIQQNQQSSSSSSTTATAAMQMQQQQHNQMTGTGGVQIVPFVNTDGSIQPINLVPQQLSVSSMQQFQMLQQNQHPFMVPQQYGANVVQLHASKQHIQGQQQSQQVSGSPQGVRTPPIPSQQTTSYQVLNSQQMRPTTQQPQTQNNAPIQQQIRAAPAAQPQPLRPIQQGQHYQGQQSHQAQGGQPQSTAAITQEGQPRYSQSVPAASQMIPQSSSNSILASQTPLQQSVNPNISSQPHNVSSNGGQHQSMSSTSQNQGNSVEDQGSSTNVSQATTTNQQQPQQPTYYFAPQPTYPLIHGLSESSNAVASTQWPQLQAMAFIPQQSGTQMIPNPQSGLSSIATTSAVGDGGNSSSSEGRQPPVAAHAFHHYQNNCASHTNIPHQLVLVPQPQNFTYLPHSGGQIPLSGYQQAAGLQSMPQAGFTPLQPAPSPIPSAASQQLSQPQLPSTSSLTKPLQQGPQQAVPLSAVNIMPESACTVVTSTHTQVVPTHSINHPASVSAQQQTMPILPQSMPQMQPQYHAAAQQPLPSTFQPSPQQLGIQPNSMVSGHQQQQVQLPVGGMMHNTVATGGVNTDIHNDRGTSSAMESSLMSHPQPQAASAPQQLPASSQASQPPTSTSMQQP